MNVVGWRAIGTPLSPFAPLFTPVQRMIHLLARQQRVFRALLNGNDDPVATATIARSKSGAIVDESRAGRHDDLMRVPGKPLGFLAASTIEYHPARPEAHRSTVLAGQKLHSSRPPKPRELPVKASLRHR